MLISTTKHLKWPLMAALALQVGCAGDDSVRPSYPSWDQNLLQVVEGNSNLSTFASAIVKAGLADTLSGSTVLTVLAPSNAAFEGVTLPENPTDEQKAALARVLLFHMVSGKQVKNLFERNTSVFTLVATTSIAVDGDQLSDLEGNSASVTGWDNQASNGVVHVIDGLLAPPTEPAPPLGNLAEVLSEAGSFGSLIELVTGTPIAALLGGEGPWTVFAPTDDALGAVDLSAADPGVVTNVLYSHVAAGKIVSADFADLGPTENLAKIPVDIDADADPVTVNGAAIGMSDIEADNGVVHALDAVIIPPTILETLPLMAPLSDLNTAVGRVDALMPALNPDTLAGDSPITVFAPTNDAFTAAGIDPTTTPTTALAQVLSYHVVVGQATAGELTDGQVLVTAEGGTLTVGIDGESVTLTDAAGNTVNVIKADVRTLSGVVHAIDGVLDPDDT